jgi:hypothetical protein
MSSPSKVRKPAAEATINLSSKELDNMVSAGKLASSHPIALASLERRTEKAKRSATLAVAAAAARAAADAAVVALDAADNCIAARLCFESQTRAATHDKMDAELRAVLFQVIDTDSRTASLEQGLGRLDVIIEEIATRVSELRRSPTPAFVKPCDIDPLLVDSCAPRKLPVIAETTLPATPDFARLVEENHVLTTESLSVQDHVSLAHRSPQQGALLDDTTRLVNDFYRTPQESPFWMINESRHSALMPAMRAFVQRGTRQLCNFWADQAADYDGAEMQWRENLRAWEYRNEKSVCYRTCRRQPAIGSLPPAKPVSSARGEGTSRASLFSLDASHSTVVSSVSATSRYAPTPIDGDESGGAGAPTRARKALRDENTEHERLMSEVLASSAKEARFERGAVDDQDLPVPLPVSILAREDPRLHDSALSCRIVPNPRVEEARFSRCRSWSDLEKCIFLDKFLQYPKNFGKIAAFFTRKRARDCARLYYDSKHAINYKALLREHQQRRRGVRICWDATAKAVQAFGGELKYDSQRNLVWFRLPVDNFSTTTTKYAYKEQHKQNTGDDIINYKRPITPAAKSTRRPTQRKEGNTKAQSPVIKGPVVLGAVSGNYTTLSNASMTMVPPTKENVSDKDELGGTSAMAQKRLRSQKPHPPSHSHFSRQYASMSHNSLDSIGSVNGMARLQAYTPPTGAPPHFAEAFGHHRVEAASVFGGHDSGRDFLGRPLSTPAFALGCQNQIVSSSALFRNRGQQQHQKHSHREQLSQSRHPQPQSQQPQQSQQLAMLQMQGDSTSFLTNLSTYGLPSTTQPHDRLQQMAPILPNFRHREDGQQFAYQSLPSHFYGGAQGLARCDPTQHPADTAYAAMLSTRSHMTESSNASSGASSGGQIVASGSDCQSRGVPPTATRLESYTSNPMDPKKFLRDINVSSCTSPNALVLHADYNKSSRFADGQSFRLPPPVSKSEPPHTAKDHPSSVTGYANTSSIGAATISHQGSMVSSTVTRTMTAKIVTNTPMSRDEATLRSKVECCPVQKWTATEKALFLRHFVTYGKNWAALASLIPTKAEAQVKTYYQNYKNRLGREDILSFRGTRPEPDISITPQHAGNRTFPIDHAANMATASSSQPTRVPAHPHLYTQGSIDGTSFVQQRHVTGVANSATDSQQNYGHILQSTAGSLGSLRGLLDIHASAADTFPPYHHAATLKAMNFITKEGTDSSILDGRLLFDPNRQAQLWQSTFFCPVEHLSAQSHDPLEQQQLQLPGKPVHISGRGNFAAACSLPNLTQKWGGSNDHHLSSGSGVSKQTSRVPTQLSQTLNEASHSTQLFIQPFLKLQPDWWPEYCS